MLKLKKLENGYGIDVSPTLIGIKDMVANVNQAYNVVEITCNYLENVIFMEKVQDVMSQPVPLSAIL